MPLARMAAIQQKCLVPACKKMEAPDMKGLCVSCYSSAKKVVDAGNTTWEAIEALGLCRLKGKSDPFSDELKKRMENS